MISAEIGNQNFILLEISLSVRPQAVWAAQTFFSMIETPQTYQLYHITRWANKWVERADIWITAEIGNQDYFLQLKISLLTSIIIIEFYRPPVPLVFTVQCHKFLDFLTTILSLNIRLYVF